MQAFGKPPATPKRTRLIPELPPPPAAHNGTYALAGDERAPGYCGPVVRSGVGRD